MLSFFLRRIVTVVVTVLSLLFGFTVPTTPVTPTPTPTPTPTNPTPTPTPTTPTPTPVVKKGAPTTVSLTFDDGNADATTAASVLGARGLAATFFVNSGTIGTSGKLTRADLSALSAAGNEIGGHSVTHVDLANVPLDETRRQVCNDRVQLAEWGFTTRSFAYPFAAVNDEVAQVAADCGYNSARGLGDIRSRFGCADCDVAETIPPARPTVTMALDEFDSRWTLTDLTSAVEAAEKSTGGWVQFTFHSVCSTATCGGLDVRKDLLASFADWLKARATTHNTSVRTVGDVVGGAAKPLVNGPAVTPPNPDNGVNNPSLETMQNGFPACWQYAPWGTNDATHSLVSPGRTGSFASKVVVTNYVDGEGKIIPSLDLGSCAPTITPGNAYTLSAWYTSTGVTQFAVYLRTTSGQWEYWTSSPWFASASSWSFANWTTDVIPAGYTGISFGLNIFAPGTLITDDYSLVKAPAAPPATPVAPSEPVTPTAQPAPPAPPAPADPPATAGPAAEPAVGTPDGIAPTADASTPPVPATASGDVTPEEPPR